MNKEIWIKTKEKHSYSVEQLYEFWINNKKPYHKELTLEEFEPLIVSYINIGNHISIERLEEYFDKKYHVLKIYDINKRLIKEM